MCRIWIFFRSMDTRSINRARTIPRDRFQPISISDRVFISLVHEISTRCRSLSPRFTSATGMDKFESSFPPETEFTAKNGKELLQGNEIQRDTIRYSERGKEGNVSLWKFNISLYFEPTFSRGEGQSVFDRDLTRLIARKRDRNSSNSKRITRKSRHAKIIERFELLCL